MPFPNEPVEIAIFNSWSLFIQGIMPYETVRLLDNNFIAPNGPYTAIKLTDIEPVSWTGGYISDPIDVTGRTESWSNFKGIISVYTYGKYSISRAQSISVGLRERASKQILRENGIGYASSTTVRNASRAINAERMEERAQFSIEFHFVQGGIDRAGDDPSIIEEVSGESNYSANCGETYDYLNGTFHTSAKDI